MRLVYLSSDFYSAHSGDTEIENKNDRPHARVLLSAEGLTFAIPFRSNIQHNHAFYTDAANHCGLDYSKAVVIQDESKEIDQTRTPYLRQNEFNALKGKDGRIANGMRRYIRDYNKAKKDPQNPRNQKLLDYSTLQYFDDLIPDQEAKDKAS